MDQICHTGPGFYLIQLFAMVVHEKNSCTKAKDSCQSFPDFAGRAARSYGNTGPTLGQMAIGQVDEERKLLEAICFLILGFSSFLFLFVSAFCFNFCFLKVQLLKGKLEMLKVGN